MAKINLDKFSSHLKEACDKALNQVLSTENTQAIANDLADQIRVRTRLGNGLDKNEGEPTKLKPLSPNYKKARAKNGQLSDQTTPNKSNLTLTGEMLDNVTGFADGRGKITIYLKDQFSRDKAKWVTEGGRPFMFISRVQVQRIKNQIQAQLTKLIKSFL
jgi:hypothetical protein